MPKRGNDNAQMRREDYEAQESRGGRDDEEGGGVFQRASGAALAKRKIFKSAKRSRQSTGGIPSSGGSSSNPFAKLELAPTAPATTGKAPTGKAVAFKFGSPDVAPDSGFTFGSTPAASKPAEKSTAGATPFVFGGATPGPTAVETPGPTPGTKSLMTGGFSFGSAKAPSEATGTNKPFQFGASPAPSTGGFTFGAAPATTNGGSKLAERFQKHAMELETGFYNECSTLALTTTFLLPDLDLYLDAAYVLESEYWKRAQGGKEKKASVSFAAPKASVSFAAASPQPGGLFGAPPPTPAPPGGLGGLPPTPATTPGTSAEEGGPSDTPDDPGTKAASGGADEDWETLEQPPYTVSFYLNNKSLCKGFPKFQQHKTSKTRRIIMRTEATGKVQVNMTANGPITYRLDKHKKYHKGVETVILKGKITPDQKDVGTIHIRRAVHKEEDKSLEDIMKPIFGS